MSMLTISEARNRAYPRKFDHEAATAKYADGASVRELAIEYGVSWSAVARVVRGQAPPTELRGDATCVDCDVRVAVGSTRCLVHAGRAQALRAFRLDGDGNVLQAKCGRCATWKNADAFSPSRRRIGGPRVCKSCVATEKRGQRAAA